jgi:hypothetical protein
MALLITAGTGLVATGLATANHARAASPAPAPAPVVAPAPVSANTKFVTRAYNDLMNRTPDGPGLAFWVGRLDAGAARIWVSAALTATPEYNRMVVSRMYLDVTGHNADEPGLAYWAGVLQHGGHAEQVAAALVAAPEYVGQFGANYKAFVDAAYVSILGQSADPAGEAFWVSNLSQGDTMAHVASAIAHSPSWYQHRVYFDYARYHIGVPDGPGQAYWTGAFQAGAAERSLVSELVASDQYMAFAVAH